MNVPKTYKNILTLGPIGYLPASGTMATLCALPIVYALHKLGLASYALLTIALIFISSFCIRKSKSDQKDPSEVIMDEVIGCLITFFNVKLNLVSISIGFILFRFFDILKPLGIKKVEQLKDWIGIIADDVLAGVIANLLLHLFIRVCG